MLPKLQKKYLVFFLPTLTLSILLILTFSLALTKLNKLQTTISTLDNQAKNADQKAKQLEEKISILESEDLRKENKQIKEENKRIKDTFLLAKKAYVDLLELREKSTKTQAFDSAFATILDNLGRDNLSSASAGINKLVSDISKEQSKLLASQSTAIPASVPENNQAPNSGFSKQKVTVNNEQFLVDIVAADLNSTKVVVDTASDNTCTDNCPVLPLATYAARSGAFAGINGTYFCPDTYPDCANKKNTFDVLVMNKNKVYFNSENNVYSSVPAAIFSGNSARFVSQSSEWGRDTGVDAVIANRPLLVLGGSVMFGGGGEAKEGIKGNRSFLGNSGNIAYIGVIHNATVADAARVLFTMGVKNALNLDSGGSIALWAGGYKVGPGRNLPNVVLFVRR